MTTKIENIRYEIFETKEDYLAFRQAWKDYINSGKAKPTFVDHPYQGKIKHSNLTGGQHLLFNILTSKDLSTTFKPSLNESKRGFQKAYHDLHTIYHEAKRLKEYDDGNGSKPSYLSQEKYEKRMENTKQEIDKFLEPFGKSFTIEMFVRLMREHVNRAKLTNVSEEESEATSEAA
jgi:hypothetical protein